MPYPPSPALSADLDADEGDFALEDFEESMRQSTSIDDFTRMIQDFRSERGKRRSGGVASAAAHPASARSSLGIHYADDGDHFLGSADALDAAPGNSSVVYRRSLDAGRHDDAPDDNMSTYTASKRGSWRASSSRPLRCTCCCARDDCEQARLARVEWSDMEQDLKLAAEIGQALLRRNDALTSEATAKEAKFTTQRDALMKRLTRSIKESSQLQKDLAQCTLNLEAADSSNRALLTELDQSRRDLKRLEADRARLAMLEARSEKLNREVDDARQEARTERKKAAFAESRARKASERASQLAATFNQRLAESEHDRQQRRDTLSAEALEQAKQRFRDSIATESASPSAVADQESLATLRDLCAQNESLQSQVDQTNALLKASNEELAELREQQQFGPTVSATYSSNLSRPSMHSRRTSSGFSDAYRVPTGIEESDLTHNGAAATVPTDVEAPSTPALADEIVFDDPAHDGPRAASRTSERSHGSIVVHSASSDIAAEGPSSSRLLATPSAAKPRWSDASTPSSSSSNGRQTPTTEAQRIRAAYSASSDAASEDTVPTTAGGGSFLTPSATTASAATSAGVAKRDGRTAQLMTLLDYVQRLFVRLASADVDTLAKRLQRQHLAGDVGHLARVTINGITRDAEGLRDHFRRLIEAEARGLNGKEDASSLGSGNSRDNKESESLVARKEFFALVKLIRDLLFEIAKLRNAVNEVQLAPNNAARILQERLGAAAQEDTGMGAWLGKLWGGGGGGASAVGTGASAAMSGTTPIGAKFDGPTANNAPSSSALPPGIGRPASRAGHHPTAPSSAAPATRTASRATAAVVPSTIAVEVKGSRASASTSSQIPHTRSADPAGLDDSPMKSGNHSATSRRPTTTLRPVPGRSASGSGGLSRVQSRALSGLFVGAPADGWSGVSAEADHHRPLSRIVDDDEIGIHQGKPAWRSGGGNGAIDYEDEDEEDENGAAPPRRMRARGLSDSSIHSTFIDHGGPDDAGARSGIYSAAPTGRMMGGAGGAGGGSAAPSARIMTKSTLALQASDPTTMPSPPLQQQRSRGLLAGLSSTLAGWGANAAATAKPAVAAATTTTTTTSAPTRPTLRSPASTAALSLAAAAGSAGGSGSAGGNRTASGSMTPTTADTLSVPVDVPAAPATPSVRSSNSSNATPEASYSRPSRSPNSRTQAASTQQSHKQLPSRSGSIARPGGGMMGARSGF